MADIALAIACPLVLTYLVLIGRKGNLHRQEGWGYVLAGLAFTICGVLIGISDSFFGVDNSVVLGGREYRSFMTSMVGYVPGFVFLCIGLWKWVHFLNARNEPMKSEGGKHDRLDSPPAFQIEHLRALNRQLAEESSRRQQMELALASSEEKIHALLETIPNGICIIRDGLIEYANPALLHITGYEAQEIAKTSIADYIPPEVIPKSDGETGQVDAGRIVQTVWQRKDGTKLNIDISFGAFDSGMGSDFLVFVCDATQQKQIKERIESQYAEIQMYSRELEEVSDELRETRKQLLETTRKLEEIEKERKAAFENANDAILYLNLHGRIVDVNSKVEEILGYKRTEIIRKNFEELGIFQPPDLERFKETIQAVGEGRIAPLREFEVIRKDGTSGFIDTRPSLIKRKGQARGILAVFRDVTDRKRLEEILHQTQEELAARIEERTRALARASAELQVETTARREAEAMAREFEAKWLSLVENSGSMILTVDRDGTIQTINHSLPGVVPSHAVSRRIYDFLHPDYSYVVRGALEKVFVAGTPTCLEVLGLGVDGGYGWYEIRVGPVRRNGEIALATVAVTDITERKLAQEALKESEKRFKELADLLPQTVFEIDMQGNFTFANNAGLQTTGYLQEDIDKGLHALSLFVPEDRKRVMEDIEKVLRGQEFGANEYTALRKDGSTFQVIAYTSPIIRDERIVGMRGIILDITERKLAEEQVAQRNRELAALNRIAQSTTQSLELNEILAGALDSILEILNIEHGGVYIRDKATNDLILQIDRGISSDMFKAISPVKMGEGIVGQTAQTGEPMVVESIPDSVDMICSKAKEIALMEQSKSLMCIPLQARGNVLGVMFTLTKGERALTPEERQLLITVSHEISTAIENAQLLEAASRAMAAEEADQLRAAFIASISHEIRTPLTEIKGFANTLVQPDVEWDAETQHDFLLSIDRASDRLLNIVNDVLDMAKIEAGVLKLNKRPVRLDRLIERLQTKFNTPAWQEKLVIRIQGYLPAIPADEERLGQAITNLVEKASEESDTIILEAKIEDSSLIVSVSDKGKGIPPEDLDRVFDHFHGIEQNTERRRSGSGLGLAICKGIIEAHGGTIWAESEVGNGSKFSFSLPIGQCSDIFEEELRSLTARLP